jgi:hypothetical protein
MPQEFAFPRPPGAELQIRIENLSLHPCVGYKVVVNGVQLAAYDPGFQDSCDHSAAVGRTLRLAMPSELLSSEMVNVRLIGEYESIVPQPFSVESVTVSLISVASPQSDPKSLANRVLQATTDLCVCSCQSLHCCADVINATALCLEGQQSRSAISTATIVIIVLPICATFIFVGAIIVAFIHCRRQVSTAKPNAAPVVTVAPHGNPTPEDGHNTAGGLDSEHPVGIGHRIAANAGAAVANTPDSVGSKTGTKFEAHRLDDDSQARLKTIAGQYYGHNRDGRNGNIIMLQDSVLRMPLALKPAPVHSSRSASPPLARGNAPPSSATDFNPDASRSSAGEDAAILMNHGKLPPANSVQLAHQRLDRMKHHRLVSRKSSRQRRRTTEYEGNSDFSLGLQGHSNHPTRKAPSLMPTRSHSFHDTGSPDDIVVPDLKLMRPEAVSHHGEGLPPPIPRRHRGLPKLQRRKQTPHPIGILHDAPSPTGMLTDVNPISR